MMISSDGWMNATKNKKNILESTLIFSWLISYEGYRVFGCFWQTNLDENFRQ